MISTELLERPLTDAISTSYLAEVISVQDPENLSRVQVQLFNFQGAANQDGPIWARVAVPFAGKNHGAFMLPNVGNEVLVTFVNGDPRCPIVVGSLWNGAAAPPEALGGAGDHIDRWAITGKAGTRIAIIEEQSGQEKISFSTPGGVRGELTDEAGGRVRIRVSGTAITADASGVRVETGGTVSVDSKASVSIKSPVVTIDAAMSILSGWVQCDTLMANTVIASTYTPGAGNTW